MQSILFSKKTKIYTIVGTICITLCVFIIVLISSYSSLKPAQQHKYSPSSTINSKSIQQEIVTPAEKPNKVSTNILFMGDVFWGRYIDDWSKASDLKLQYPFSGLSSFNRSAYDAWIGGLECPITTTYLDSTTQDRLLKFSCLPEYTPEAAKWFTAFTLANNHTDNMEEVNGFDQTKGNLSQNGIQYFGHYDNSQTKEICAVLSIPARVIFSNHTEASSLPFAFCGFHNIFKLPTQDQMQTISAYSKHFPTIVMPHQGKEYTYTADQLQRSYARQYIDLGADAVIGNHVHSVQDTESYKGKLIVYSMGNFIFDQQFSPQVTQSIAPNLNLSVEYSENVQKYLDLAKECSVSNDTCLEKAALLKITKPPIAVTYDFVASDNSNKLTKKGSENLKQQLMTTTKWNNTLQGLSAVLGN